MNGRFGKNGYLQQAWLVILLALVFGGALAGVQRTLGPRIVANRLRETLEVIPTLVAGADQSRTQELTVEAADGRSHRVYEAVAADGELAGWVIPASGQGFADEIRLLVGLDPQVEMITGIYVLDQKETPGLGALISGDSFVAQFKDVPTNRTLEIVTAPPTAATQIKALTGATISSQSVAQIVNTAISQLKESLQKRYNSLHSNK